MSIGTFAVGGCMFVFRNARTQSGEGYKSKLVMMLCVGVCVGVYV